MITSTFRWFPLLVWGASGVGAALTADPNESAPGWASQGGGTTGGKGGTVVTVTTIADLQKYASATGKYVIYVKGVMGDPGTKGVVSGDRVSVASDKTILGLPGAWVKGGFDIKSGSNIIVRNLRISGPGATSVQGNDAVHIEGSNTRNIWFDHCDVHDGMDGNFDVTNGADYVTVTWTKFRYTELSAEHQLSNLIGGSTKAEIAALDKGHLRVTLFKNWWGDGVSERQPRVRFGQVHVINNLYTSRSSTTGVRVGQESNVLIEKNVFIAIPRPVDIYNDVAAGQTETGMVAKVTPDNLFTDIPKGNTAGFNEGSVFTPPYTLTGVLAAAVVEKTLQDPEDGAGATIDAWSGVPSGVEASRGQGPSFALRTLARGVEIENVSASVATVRIRDLSGREASTERTIAMGETARFEVPRGVFVVHATHRDGTWSRPVQAVR